MSENQMISGSHVSDGNPFTIPVPMGWNRIRLVNQTIAQTNNPAVATDKLVQSAEGDFDMAAGSAILYRKKTGTNDIENPPCTTGGFTVKNPASPGSNPNVALGAPFFTQANPVEWTTATNHGYVVGDIVRFSSVTGARQYAGIDFSVIDISGGAKKFKTLLNTTGVPIPTAGNVRKLNFDTSFYYPRKRFISSVTKAASAVVALTVRHQFKVGEYVRFVVPAAYGMIELDGLRGKITAIDTTITVNTITVDIDSLAFTAFAFPATGAVPFTFAQVIPDSEFPQFIDAAVENDSFLGIECGTNLCGTASDVFRFYVWRSDQNMQNV